jgi:hypothetical protein
MDFLKPYFIDLIKRGRRKFGAKIVLFDKDTQGIA